MIMSGMQPRYARSYAPVGGAVVADEAGAVEDEADGQLLDRAVVHHLVVPGELGREEGGVGGWGGAWEGGGRGGGGGGGVCAPALEEGRVDGAERLDALDGEAGGEGHRVLLRNPDVIRPLGEAFAEAVDAGAARHRRGDRHHRAVVGGDVDERVGEDGGVRRALGELAWGEGRGGRGEAGRPRGAGAGRGRAPLPVATSKRGTPWYLSEARSVGAEALLRLHVEEDGWLPPRSRMFKDGHQVVHVAVDGADVVNPSLEERAAGHHAARTRRCARSPARGEEERGEERERESAARGRRRRSPVGAPGGGSSPAGAP